MQGFWTTRGAPASVDWCEPNYRHSAYIAEWWNTLSSLVIVALGLYGLAWVLRRRDRLEPRFLACFVALTLVGVGSVAFHATLLQVAQAADELPMVYGSLVLLYCLVTRRPGDAARERLWAFGLTAYAVLFTVAYGALEAYFVWFIWSYGIIAGLLVIGTVRIALGPTGGPTHRRIAGAAAGAIVGAFLLFWLPEHVLLGCDHPLQALELHSLWHTVAGTGTYLGILFAVHDRLTIRGQPADLGAVLPSALAAAEA